MQSFSLSQGTKKHRIYAIIQSCCSDLIKVTFKHLSVCTLYALCLECIIQNAFVTVFILLLFQAKESIDQLVYLCRADKEEVRDAAKQTLLVLGNNNLHIIYNRTARLTLFRL